MDSLLLQRLKPKEGTPSKAAALGQRSAEGGLSSFAGLFRPTPLLAHEKKQLEELLLHHAPEGISIQEDLEKLSLWTGEVRAINHQAALLHGERIFFAQQLLIRYREGAFSSWLITAYGNRQTPYNLLQYYTFYQAAPKELQPKIEQMPKQAVYVLASREGEVEKKQALVAQYHGETKHELLQKIRSTFPLATKDKRRARPAQQMLRLLQQVDHLMTHRHIASMSSSERAILKEMVKRLLSSLT